MSHKKLKLAFEKIDCAAMERKYDRRVGSEHPHVSGSGCFLVKHFLGGRVMCPGPL